MAVEFTLPREQAGPLMIPEIDYLKYYLQAE